MTETRESSVMVARDGRRPQILWLTTEPPDRHGGGANIRLAHLVESVARVADTHLVTCGAVTDSLVRSAVASIRELDPVTAWFPRRPQLQRGFTLALMVLSRFPLEVYRAGPSRRALSAARRDLRGCYDITLVENEALAMVARADRSTPRVMTLHHLLSGMALDEQRHATSRRHRWLLSAQARKGRRLERATLGLYDLTCVCSDEDARTVDEHQVAHRAPEVIPNGVDLQQFTATPVPSNRNVLFSGTMNYLPNTDATRWFTAQVWPRVRSRHPDAELSLVGRHPLPEVRDLANLPGVRVHADVPSLVPFYGEARVVVVPVRIGTGTRLKVLEAMASSRPVVSTAIGIQGIDVVDGRHARVEDDAAAFAAAVCDVLEDDRLAARLAEGGRALAEEHFGWDLIGDRFADLILALVRDQNRRRCA